MNVSEQIIVEIVKQVISSLNEQALGENASPEHINGEDKRHRED